LVDDKEGTDYQFDEVIKNQFNNLNSKNELTIKFDHYQFPNSDYEITGSNITVIEKLQDQYTIRIDNILNYDYRVVAPINIRVDLVNLSATKIQSADF
jgi:hypothetical protein